MIEAGFYDDVHEGAFIDHALPEECKKEGIGIFGVSLGMVTGCVGLVAIGCIGGLIIHYLSNSQERQGLSEENLEDVSPLLLYEELKYAKKTNNSNVTDGAINDAMDALPNKGQLIKLVTSSRNDAKQIDKVLQLDRKIIKQLYRTHELLDFLLQEKSNLESNGDADAAELLHCKLKEAMTKKQVKNALIDVIIEYETILEVVMDRVISKIDEWNVDPDYNHDARDDGEMNGNLPKNVDDKVFVGYSARFDDDENGTIVGGGNYDRDAQDLIYATESEKKRASIIRESNLNLLYATESEKNQAIILRESYLNLTHKSTRSGSTVLQTPEKC